jgi:NADPH:quinone reductase-like Zn-dependent oxidoreductase
MQNDQPMKAIAVMHPGSQPEYTTHFTAPVPDGDDQVSVRMKAVAVKHLDKLRASGKHYSALAGDWKPKIVGSDGVGLLQDGRRVYGIGLNGTMAEQVVLDKDMIVPVPAGLTDALAAALPNGVMGSAMALKFRAKLQPGATVLINGATGFTGAIAVQLAKHYGAGKVIATGRNEAALQRLKDLGADELIALKVDDHIITGRLRELHRASPIDIVIDYLWGHSATLILEVLKGNGSFTHRTSYVTVGGMAGDEITLSSAILRSTDLQISGSGLGSWSKEEMALLFGDILPETFALAAQGRLAAETETCSMEDIGHVWAKDFAGGKRLVVLV